MNTKISFPLNKEANTSILYHVGKIAHNLGSKIEAFHQDHKKIKFNPNRVIEDKYGFADFGATANHHYQRAESHIKKLFLPDETVAEYRRLIAKGETKTNAFWYAMGPNFGFKWVSEGCVQSIAALLETVAGATWRSGQLIDCAVQGAKSLVTSEKNSEVISVKRHSKNEIEHQTELLLKDLFLNPHLKQVEIEKTVRTQVGRIVEQNDMEPGTQINKFTQTMLVEQTNQAIKKVVQYANLAKVIRQKSVFDGKIKIGGFEFSVGLSREKTSETKDEQIVIYLENKYGRFSARPFGDGFLFYQKATPLEGHEKEFEKLRKRIRDMLSGKIKSNFVERESLIARLAEINKVVVYSAKAMEITNSLKQELEIRDNTKLPIDEYLLRVDENGVVKCKRLL